MRKRLPLLVAVSLCALLGSALTAVAGGLSANIPTSARMGEAVRFSVTLNGESGEARVVLHFRSKGATRYSRVDMLPLPGGGYSAEVPPVGTRSPELRYYIEAIGPDASFNYGLGSEKSPLALLLLEPASQGLSDVAIYGMGFLVPMAFIIGVVMLRERKRKSELVDQLFWAQLLSPLARLPRWRSAEQVAKLAETTFDHPVDGPTKYSREQILEKLHVVRGLDRSRLDEVGRRFLGDEHEMVKSVAVAMNDAQLGSELKKLALRVGRLYSVAYLLARHRETVEEGGHRGVNELVKPLSEAREAIRSAQLHLKQGRQAEVHPMVPEISENVERILRSIGVYDASFMPGDFAHILSSSQAITADVLCQLVEYYALTASPSLDTRRKLVTATRSLAERDAIEANSSDGVRRSIVRRRLLTTTRDRVLPQEMTEQASRLEKSLFAAEPRNAAELDRLKAKVEHYIESIGKLVYCIDGLSHAVALEVLLEEKRAWFGRQQLGSFDELRADVEELDLVGSETMEFVAEVVEEREAHDLLVEVEAELRQAVVDKACVERKFYLEKVEFRAACEPESKWAGLIVRTAACRTAIDRLAQDHAKARQPRGMKAKELPRELAIGLIRTATNLETDLREQIDRDLIHNKESRADYTRRVIQRIARARLGLAVMGAFPATGFGDRKAVAADIESETIDIPRTEVAGVA